MPVKFPPGESCRPYADQRRTNDHVHCHPQRLAMADSINGAITPKAAGNVRIGSAADSGTATAHFC